MPIATDQHDAQLRSFGADGDQRLPERALRYLNYIDFLSITISLAVVAVIAWFVFEPPVRTVILAIAAAAWVIGVLFEIRFLNRILVRKTSYSVTRDEVYIARGMFFRRFTSIPVPQILNVEILEGPVLRKFALVKVRFTCITDIEPLGPLSPEAAEEIRDTVLTAQRSTAHDE